MKKIIFMAAILCAVLASCANTSGDSGNDSGSGSGSESKVSVTSVALESFSYVDNDGNALGMSTNDLYASKDWKIQLSFKVLPENASDRTITYTTDSSMSGSVTGGGLYSNTALTAKNSANKPVDYIIATAGGVQSEKVYVHVLQYHAIGSDTGYTLAQFKDAMVGYDSDGNAYSLLSNSYSEDYLSSEGKYILHIYECNNKEQITIGRKEFADYIPDAVSAAVKASSSYEQGGMYAYDYRDTEYFNAIVYGGDCMGLQQGYLHEFNYAYYTPGMTRIADSTVYANNSSAMINRDFGNDRSTYFYGWYSCGDILEKKSWDFLKYHGGTNNAYDEFYYKSNL